MKNPLTEKDVKATARKAGLKLQESGRRAASGLGAEMAYRVIDPVLNLVVFGDGTNGYGCSLEQCAAYLNLSPGERWYKLQKAVQLAEHKV